jgi:hypothetical protein
MFQTAPVGTAGFWSYLAATRERAWRPNCQIARNGQMDEVQPLPRFAQEFE